MARGETAVGTARLATTTQRSVSYGLFVGGGAGIAVGESGRDRRPGRRTGASLYALDRAQPGEAPLKVNASGVGSVRLTGDGLAVAF